MPPTGPLLKWRGVPKIRFWDQLLDYLREYPEFGGEEHTTVFSYDWRQSLLDTAMQLGKYLDAPPRRLRYGELSIRWYGFESSDP